jgi:hypothetical protein
MELSDDEEASRRLGELVDSPAGLSAQIILDQQLRLLTKQKRDVLTAESSQLRDSTDAAFCLAPSSVSGRSSPSRLS